MEKTMRPVKGRKGITCITVLAISLCIISLPAFVGCGDNAGEHYRLAVSMKEDMNHLFAALRDSSGFLEALKTFDLKSNPDIFVELTASLEKSLEACGEATVFLDEIEELGAEIAPAELENPLAMLKAEVESYTARVEDMTAYLYALNDALAPFKAILSKTRDASEEGMDIKDANTPEVLARYETFLASQDEVLASLDIDGIPPVAVALHDAVVEEINSAYRETFGILTMIKSQANITIGSGDDSTQEISPYVTAIYELEDEFDMERVEDEAGPLQDFLFEYLVKNKPEADE